METAFVLDKGVTNEIEGTPSRFGHSLKYLIQLAKISIRESGIDEPNRRFVIVESIVLCLS